MSTPSSRKVALVMDEIIRSTPKRPRVDYCSKRILLISCPFEHCFRVRASSYGVRGRSGVLDGRGICNTCKQCCTMHYLYCILDIIVYMYHALILLYCIKI